MNIILPEYGIVKEGPNNNQMGEGQVITEEEGGKHNNNKMGYGKRRVRQEEGTTGSATWNCQGTQERED